MTEEMCELSKERMASKLRLSRNSYDDQPFVIEELVAENNVSLTAFIPPTHMFTLTRTNTFYFFVRRINTRQPHATDDLFE
jgi:hypothetical protein